MDYRKLYSEIMILPVWDTHNHLDGSKYLCAQSFWDIVHYFWFVRELEGVGYPWVAEAMEMPKKERAEAFAKAFDIGRNTYWNQSLRQMLKDLWDVEITDSKSILEADERIAETGQRRGWAREVCERFSINTITVNRISDNGLQDMEDIVCIMGGCRLPGARQLQEIQKSSDQLTIIKQEAVKIKSHLVDLFNKGFHVLRVQPPTGVDIPELQKSGNKIEDIDEYLKHYLFRILDENKAHLQIFLGMEAPAEDYEPRTKAHRHYAVNDTRRIADIHDIFDMYSQCTFEIINAAQLSNLDIVQAARIYPNVVPGGLWWFNFRASTYKETMQYRLEALPATRCTLPASDARCIEWCYCKTHLVKRLLADFLWDRLERGWLDHELAIYVAREWLYDAAARFYRGLK
ncbi:hypothetical protein GF312_06795 [Candidatus Poribacteria bacterium]|nr:hypothetical protein [Candidatus Poribacteria bacterium]